MKTTYALTPQVYKQLTSFMQINDCNHSYSLVPKYPERASINNSKFCKVLIYKPCLFPESPFTEQSDPPKTIGCIQFTNFLEATTAGQIVLAELESDNYDEAVNIMKHAIEIANIETIEPDLNQCMTLPTKDMNSNSVSETHLPSS